MTSREDFGERLVQLFRSAREEYSGDGEFEVEIKLGTIVSAGGSGGGGGDGGYNCTRTSEKWDPSRHRRVSGVSESYFSKVLERLREDPALSAIVPSVTTDIMVGSFRVTVGVNGTVLASVHKERLAVMDTTTPSLSYDPRVTVSVETPVPPEDVMRRSTSGRESVSVRHKERYSFEGEGVRFDLTKVVIEPMMAVTVYEIEVESTDTNRLDLLAATVPVIDWPLE